MSARAAPSALIRKTVEGAIRGLVRADVELREASLRRLHDRSMGPNLLVAVTMGMTLRFTVGLNQSQSLLFGRFGTKHRRPVADIRLSFELRPALAPPRLIIDAGRLRFGPPPFYRFTGSSSRFDLVLADGQLITVALDGDRVRIVVEDDGGLLCEEPWPPSLVVSLIDTLVEWSRRGPGVNHYRIDLVSENRLDSLLARIFSGYQQIAAAVVDIPATPGLRDANRRLYEVYPGLGGSYRLSSMEASLLLQLNRRGDLVTEVGDPDWQQYDLHVRFIPTPGSPIVNLSVKPADVLVDGPFHQAFVSSLRTEDGMRQLRTATTEWRAEDFQDFILNPGLDARSAFVRIRYDDLDLVLLRGVIAGEQVGLLYLVKFEVEPFPNVRVKKITWVKLLSSLHGSGVWNNAVAPDTGVQAHFQRFFLMLAGWHQRIQKAGAHLG